MFASSAAEADVPCKCEEGGLADASVAGGGGSRYATDRHSPIERYVPGPRYDRYPVAAPALTPPAPAPTSVGVNVGVGSRFVDPYARRDLFSPAPPPPPPVAAPPAPSLAPSSRYLRPVARYTPRPTRIEYRTHVEYLGSSGGRSVQTDFASHSDSGCVDVFEQDHSPEDLFRAALYINTPRTPREREYSRTPPLGRSEAPIERGRVSAESQTPPVPTSVSAPGGGSVVGSLSLAPAPCCSAPRRVLPTAPAPVSLTPQHHHHQLPQHSSNIW
ncbi:unnamed protein product [Nesidiocoris tenuis]|uniref:Uncharacterized protein n=1 Tax=Nesidiocoris tenuis TaxID=355587 RepID=A0A6H5HA34_9HEMI|nr:unnamed protein product [Nesidiocoris tenuis]CAB0013749.1 unnamed protein product [Nesidiocoris tenuis]